MTINYDWYTTNYRHSAVYATLIVKITVYNKPFTFLKNQSTIFSSTGQRPASYCHGVVSGVCPYIRPSVCL